MHQTAEKNFKIPYEDRLVRALNHYDDFFRGYALQWATKNLCPRDLAWYFEAATLYRPWMHRSLQSLVDRMGQKVRAYRTGKIKWIKRKLDPFRSSYRSSLEGGDQMGTFEPAMEFPAHYVSQDEHRYWEKQAALDSWAKPLAPYSYEQPVLGQSDDDILDFEKLFSEPLPPDTSTPTKPTTTTTPTTTKPTTTTPAPTGGFNVADPLAWMKMIETGTKSVSSIACMADPKLPFCPGATTAPIKPPATMEDLCRQIPTFAPCAQYQQQQAKAALCKQFPAQCAPTAASAGLPAIVPPKKDESWKSWLLAAAAAGAVLFFATRSEAKRSTNPRKRRRKNPHRRGRGRR